MAPCRCGRRASERRPPAAVTERVVEGQRLTQAVFGFLERWQTRHVFRALDIHPQADKRGFTGYLLAYQVLTSAAALRGYGQHIVGSSRSWK